MRHHAVGNNYTQVLSDNITIIHIGNNRYSLVDNTPVYCGTVNTVTVDDTLGPRVRLGPTVTSSHLVAPAWSSKCFTSCKQCDNCSGMEIGTDLYLNAEELVNVSLN